MKTSKDTPAFLRYFNARFKPFTNPIFLLSLGGLSIAGLAVYQYWHHHDWLQTNSDSLTNTPTVENQKLANTSAEDLAAAANLDNINLLLQELEQNETSNAISTENSPSNKKSSKLRREKSEFSRFQEEQKNKLSNVGKSSSSDSSNLYSVGVGTGNNKLIELLQPPSFSSYKSSRSNTNTGISQPELPSTNIIPNPVGNSYLSNRNQLQSPQAITNPPTNIGGISAGNSNNAVLGNNPGETANSVLGEENSQVTSNSSLSNNLGNRSIPASSLLQSRQTLPNPITNSIVQPSSTGLNSYNSYLGVGINSNNPYVQQNNQVANPINGTTPNTSNGVNGVGGVNSVSGTNNLGTNYQSFQQRPIVPGLTTIPNNVTQQDSSETAPGNNPNVLQNNYRSSRLTTPNYSRSAPIGYQLQPQSYSRGSIGQQNSGFSGTVNSPNSTGVGVGINGNTSSIGQPITNTPITRPFGTPSLQPSGRLSTSEIGR